MPASRVMPAMASMSAMLSSGLVGVSIQTTLVSSLIAARMASTSLTATVRVRDAPLR